MAKNSKKSISLARRDIVRVKGTDRIGLVTGWGVSGDQTLVQVDFDGVATMFMPKDLTRVSYLLPDPLPGATAVWVLLAFLAAFTGTMALTYSLMVDYGMGWVGAGGLGMAAGIGFGSGLIKAIVTPRRTTLR